MELKENIIYRSGIPKKYFIPETPYKRYSISRMYSFSDGIKQYME